MMKTYDAAKFLEAVDASRESEGVAVGMCGSCGQRPAATGFVMCVPCRDAAGLPTSDEIRAASDAALAKERADQDAARARLKARREGSTMNKPSGKTAIMHCQYCAKEVHGGQGKAAHERHCKDNPKNAVQPAPETRTAIDYQTGDVVAEGLHCDDYEECIRDLAHTPCGADPCELIDETTLEDIVKRGGTVELTAKVDVSVDVIGLPIVKRMVSDYEKTIEVLAERVIELEGEQQSLIGRIFGGPAVTHTVESVREWAAEEVERKAREKFRATGFEMVLQAEAELFGQDGDAA